MNELKSDIGKRIRLIRKNMQISQKDFASSIGMKTQYLSNVEKGLNGLTIEKVVQICNYANISADYLIFGKNNIPVDTFKENINNYSDEDITGAFDVLKKILLCIKDL